MAAATFTRPPSRRHRRWVFFVLASARKRDGKSADRASLVMAVGTRQRNVSISMPCVARGETPGRTV